MADYYGGQVITSNATGTNTATLTLPTPGPGKVNKVLSVAAYVVGVTTADVGITKNDGSTYIWRVGGVGTAALTNFDIGNAGNVGDAGICGARGDAAKVIVTTTNGSACQISAIHTLTNG